MSCIKFGREFWVKLLLRFIRISSCVCACLWITACQSIFYGKDALIPLASKYDYLHSQQTEPLQVPADLSAQRIVDYFPIPPVSSIAEQYPTGERLNLEPPIIILSSLRDTSVLENSGRQVLLIKRDKDQVWAELGRFLNQKSAGVLDFDKQNYQLLSNWVEFEDDNIWRDVFGSVKPKQTRKLFKFDLSDGPLPQSTMVVVEQVGNQAQYRDAPTQWVNLAPSSSEAIQLLNQFTMHFEAILEQQQKQISAQAVHITLTRAYSGHMALQADAEFEQIWLQLPLVFEQLGFEVEDKDRSLGLYYVELDTSNFHLPWSNQKQEKLPLEDGRYRVQLGENGKNTSILLLDSENQPLNAHTVQLLVQPFLDAFSTISKH